MPAAVRIAGVESLSVTINGIGERCGNASLEGCAVALKILYGIDLVQLTAIMRPVAALLEAVKLEAIRTKKPVGEERFRELARAAAAQG